MKNNEKAWPGSISRPVTAINRKVHRLVKVVDGERPRPESARVFQKEQVLRKDGGAEDRYKSGIGTGTVSSHVYNPVSREGIEYPFCANERGK